MTERAAQRLEQPVEVLELDVNNPADLGALTETLRERWGRVDGALHAIAFAPPDALGGNFMRTPPESAAQAFVTSAYSFKALAAALAQLLRDQSCGLTRRPANSRAPLRSSRRKNRNGRFALKSTACGKMRADSASTPTTVAAAASVPRSSTLKSAA